MSNLSNSPIPNSSIPTAAQLTDTRLKQWHQQGEALLTFENLRAWINVAGLVLFAPRPQVVAPAPSLVEAVLGAPNANPTLEQTAEARSLLARMVAEGLAVPLNLLGAPGTGVHDVPDFVVSTAVFSYIFTLRGDKAWKQPPSLTGPVKVSNLALAIYEVLARLGPTSASDLAAEVGKEVTEAAVLRALSELWGHMRVLPATRADGGATLWELTSARFTKQMKAGANAGQPSALSALVSLYLGQVVAASEDEIESFLSPLAPRSRIRDVVHALIAARQLETIAIEGRTMVHVAGAAPAFVAAEVQAPPVREEVEVGEDAAGTKAGEVGGGEETSSITKYVPKPRKVGTGYLAKAKPARFAGKPDRREGGAKRGMAGGSKPGFGERSRPKPDAERRPFKRSSSAPSRSGGFDKPWNDERPRKFAAGQQDRNRDERGPRKPFDKRKSFEGKREGFEGKPRFGESRPSRRDFSPRPDRERRGERPERRGSSGFGPRKPFGSRPQGDKDASFRKDRFADRPREDRGAKPRREYSTGNAESEGKRYRKFDAPRERGDRPSSGRPSGGFARKNAGGSAPRRDGKPGGFAGKPGVGKKPFSAKKSGGAGTSGPFAKFHGNKKPFGKRPPARKFKPKQGESD